MAKLKEGSVIMKASGDERIATTKDINNIFSTKTKCNEYSVAKKSFLPNVRGGNIPGETAYHEREGEYMLLGEIVLVSIYVRVAKMSGSTGSLCIYNLPYAANERTVFGISQFKGIKKDGYHQLQAGVDDGASFIKLYITNYSTGNRRDVQVDDVWNSELRLNISGSYIRR